MAGFGIVIGEQKGLQQTLEERGFNVSGMHAEYSQENNNCCMAQLFGKQDLNKMILLTKFQCLRPSSKKLVMNVSSFQNFTVNLIQLKWYVILIFYNSG